MEKSDVEKMISSVGKEVVEIAKKIGKIKTSGFVTLDELEEWRNTNLKNSRAIYIFTVDKTFDKKKLNNTIYFTRYSDDSAESKIAISQVNEVEKSRENCLYVGGSQKIMSRINEHITKNSAGTSAMHLKTWFDEVSGSKKIELTVIELSDDATDDEMQDLEDFVWKYFRPMMGKQCPKSRPCKKI